MPLLRVGDQQLFYTWSGAAGGPGPVLVLVHGLGSSSSFWTPVVPALAAAGFPCLAFDTPGSALSPWPGRDSDAPALAATAAALLAAVGVDAARAVAVGHSMGAVVAAEMAARLGVAGAVLVGPVDPSPALAAAFAARIKLIDDGEAPHPPRARRRRLCRCRRR